MPQVIDIPGQGQVEFPDGMSDEQIVAAIKQNSQLDTKEQSPRERILQTVDKYTRFLPAQFNPGLGEAALSMGSGAIAAPIAGLAGIAGAALPGPQNQGGDWTRAVQRALTYQPRLDSGQQATQMASYPFEKLAQFADAAGNGVNTSNPNAPLLARYGANAKVLTQKDVTDNLRPLVATGVNTAIQGLPALLLRGRGKVAADGDTSASAVRPAAAGAEESTPAAAAPAQGGRPSGLAAVSPATPTLDELRAAASAAYKRAEDAGITVSAPSFDTLKAKISKDLGEVDPTLHPDTTAVVKRIGETTGDVTLQKLENLRRIANDAQSSLKPADQRLAAKVVDNIDEYIDGLSSKDVTGGNAAQAAALKEARNYWSRVRKTETIDELMRRAELSAPNFSGSGMENALRTEFRALAKNQRKMKRFTPDEQAAIAKVAKGGPMENVLRFVGKLAPTGVVSTALSSGLGAMLGGPVGAAALPVAGFGSRLAATRMTMGNARLAQELMRRGPPGSAPVQRPIGLLSEVN